MLIGPSIHLFRVPLYRGRGQANVYFIDGSRLTLVDAGSGDEWCLHMIERELERLNHRIEDLELIVNTHAHPDHTGGDAEMQRRSGAEIAIHPLDARALQDPASFWTEEATRVRELFTISGAPEFTQFLTTHLLSRGPHRIKTPNRTEVSTLLNEPSTIELGHLTLRVIHTPGHTPGHISLYDPDSGIAFTGDHILQETTPNVQDLTSFVTSLNKILHLEPRVALPGHEEIIHEPKRRVLELLEHHRGRERAFLNLLRESQGKTLFQLSREYWGYLSPRNLLLALQEARAHMQKLTQEGRVTEQWRGKILYYLLSEA